MELYQYLFERKKNDESFTYREFAEEILKISRQRLCAIAHYRIKPSDEMAMLIEKATGGLVPWPILIEKALQFKKKREKEKCPKTRLKPIIETQKQRKNTK